MRIEVTQLCELSGGKTEPGQTTSIRKTYSYKPHWDECCQLIMLNHLCIMNLISISSYALDD